MRSDRQKIKAWRATAGSAALVRRAGLNSFGFGGVNVHLVLEEYPGE